MRPHGRTGEGTGHRRRLAQSAGNSAHRPAAAGCLRGRSVEPAGCPHAAGIAARAPAASGTASITISLCGRLPTALRPIADARCWNFWNCSTHWFCPQAIDEIGMSGDRTAVPPLIAMAASRRSQGPFSALLQAQSDRVTRPAAGTGSGPVLRNLSKPRKCGNMSIIANCASRPRRRWRKSILATAPGARRQRPGAGGAGHCSARFGSGCPWVRQRRYERMVLRKPFRPRSAVRGAKSRFSIRELSLGGGMGTKEDNLRVGTRSQSRNFRRGWKKIRGAGSLAPRTRQ